MLKDSRAFSGFSVSDLGEAKEFYQNKLGLDVTDGAMGLQIKVAGGNPIFVYEKADHTPADYTILNFPVEDIDSEVDELTKNGVVFEVYDNMPGAQDEKGILRGKAANQGPDIAWFKDPAGNVLSVLSD
jgi:predicted enzyme related to lactoylglutathione lyase